MPGILSRRAERGPPLPCLHADAAWLRSLGLLDAELEYALLQCRLQLAGVQFLRQRKHATEARHAHFSVGSLHALRHPEVHLALDGQGLAFNLKAQFFLGHARQIGVERNAFDVLDDIHWWQKRGELGGLWLPS